MPLPPTQRRSLSAGLILAAFLAPVVGLAQGRLDRVEGHYVGALDFFNTQAGARHRVPHPNPATNGLQGDKDGWLGEGDVQVRGLMQGAQLNVDWWVLFGEPVADYTFVWQSTGRYEIRYTDPKKGRITATISRDKIAKYPALLQRFDGLKPVEANFEIQWRIGDQSGKDREAFKQRHRLFGSIGSAAPHVKTAMTTRLHDGMFIYEPAGVKPFHAPSSPPGGWKAFGSLPDSLDSTKIKMLADYFDISTGQVVNDFRATKFRWPYGEMKALAQALARLESGEELPSPAQEAREKTAQPLPRYTARDEWAEATGFPIDPTEPKRILTESVDPATGRRMWNYQDSRGQMLFPRPYYLLSWVVPELFIMGDRPGALGLFDRSIGQFLIPPQCDDIDARPNPGNRDPQMANQGPRTFMIHTTRTISQGPIQEDDGGSSAPSDGRAYIRFGPSSYSVDEVEYVTYEFDDLTRSLTVKETKRDTARRRR